MRTSQFSTRSLLVLTTVVAIWSVFFVLDPVVASLGFVFWASTVITCHLVTKLLDNIIVGAVIGLGVGLVITSFLLYLLRPGY